MKIGNFFRMLISALGILGLAVTAEASCVFQADSINYGKCQHQADKQDQNYAHHDATSCLRQTTDSIQYGKCFKNQNALLSKDEGNSMRFDSTNCQRGGCDIGKTWAH